MPSAAPSSGANVKISHTTSLSGSIALANARTSRLTMSSTTRTNWSRVAAWNAPRESRTRPDRPSSPSCARRAAARRPSRTPACRRRRSSSRALRGPRPNCSLLERHHRLDTRGEHAAASLLVGAGLGHARAPLRLPLKRATSKRRKVENPQAAVGADTLVEPATARPCSVRRPHARPARRPPARAARPPPGRAGRGAAPARHGARGRARAGRGRARGARRAGRAAAQHLPLSRPALRRADAQAAGRDRLGRVRHGDAAQPEQPRARRRPGHGGDGEGGGRAARGDVRPAAAPRAPDRVGHDREPRGAVGGARAAPRARRSCRAPTPTTPTRACAPCSARATTPSPRTTAGRIDLDALAARLRARRRRHRGRDAGHDRPGRGRRRRGRRRRCAPSTARGCTSTRPTAASSP